jgi:hypothetical protein
MLFGRIIMVLNGIRYFGSPCIFIRLMGGLPVEGRKTSTKNRVQL